MIPLHSSDTLRLLELRRQVNFTVAATFESMKVMFSFFRIGTWHRALYLIIGFVGSEFRLAIHLLRGERTFLDLVRRLVADDSGFSGRTVETDQSRRKGLHHDIFREQQAGCSQEGNSPKAVCPLCLRILCSPFASFYLRSSCTEITGPMGPSVTFKAILGDPDHALLQQLRLVHGADRTAHLHESNLEVRHEFGRLIDS